MNIYSNSPYNLGTQGQMPTYPQQQSFRNPTLFPQTFGFGQQYPIAGVTPQAYQQGAYGQETFGSQQPYGQEFGNVGQRGGMHISPEEFTGVLGRPGRSFGTLSQTDSIFAAELARSARGLQDVADQLENRDSESQKKGLFAATAHVFYAFGLLSSKGIFIPSDMPGRGRNEGIGPATACRELGKVLERVVDKYANGQGIADELTLLMERGKVCYHEVTRSIEMVTGTSGGSQETGAEQGRKKAA